MPWCPVCKNEYKEGYTHCTDCNEELVESLEELPIPVLFGDERPVKTMTEFLQANGLKEVFHRYDEKNKSYIMFVPKDKVDIAKNMLSVFMQETAKRQQMMEQEQQKPQMFYRKSAQQEMNAEAEDKQNSEMESAEDLMEESAVDTQEEKTPDRRKTGAYVDKNAKAEEYKASAFALLLVGAIGVVCLVLFWAGVLPFQMYGMGKYVFTGVMGFLFLVFLVMGFNSIKMYKSYLTVADNENNLIKDINAFLEQNLTKEQIDASLNIPSNAQMEEDMMAQLYFVRMEYIKKRMLEHFADLDLPLAEKMSDDWYCKQYDE